MKLVLLNILTRAVPVDDNQQQKLFYLNKMI
jgi:hypothetical protein